MLVVALLVAYHNSFGVPLLLDDFYSIVDNESIHRIGGWWAAFSPRAQVFTAGRPLLNLSYAVNYAAGGLAVNSYHVLNFLIHAGAAVTLWAVVRRTLARDPRGQIRAGADRFALIAALLWALHPIQTVSVTYISQRAESLMGLLYLLTLYGFINAAERRTTGWRVFTVAACLAGMMTKEVMATAPAIVFLFDYVFVAGSFQRAWRERKGLHLSLAATWIVLLVLMFSTRVAERGVGYRFGFGWFDYVKVEAGAVLHYLKLTLWPFPLVFDYGQEAAVPGAFLFMGFLLAIAVLLALSIVALLRRSPLGFLGCWFFLILAPTSSIVPVAGQPIAENRIYLPLAAVAVLLAASAQWGGRRTRLALLTGAGALGLLAIARNQVYETEVGIWADTVAKRPGSARAHLNYGTALARANRIDAECVRELETSVRINPRYAAAHASLASVYFQLNRLNDAVPHFQAALAVEPNDPLTHSNFGATLFQLGRWDESLQHFLEALRIRPTHAASRINAGILFARAGRPDEAVAMFEETLRMYPNDTNAREQLSKLRAAIQAGAFQNARRTP